MIPTALQRFARAGACAIAAVAAAAPMRAQDTTVIAGANVLPMTSRAVLARRNVTIVGARIVAVDSGAAPAASSRVRVIDGRGKFLVPGLTDAHVLLELEERRWLPVFLSYGVTTVFNLRGEARHIALRTDVAEGKTPGPTIYTSGAYVNLPGIESAADATRAAAEQKAAGYDFVKIHGNLSPEAYRALTTEGRRVGIPIIGHAPRNLPFDSLIANRQTMVAHAEEILYTHFRRPDTTGLGALGPRMRDAKIWLTPNLVAYTLIARQIGRPAVIDSMLAFDDAKQLLPGIVTYWHSGAYTNRPLNTAPTYETNRQFLNVVTLGLHVAGVRMLAGTDTPLPGIYPGRSLHDELDFMVQAGFSTFDALATATVLPGQFVDEAVRPGSHFGAIAAGMRADLLLVDSNPLDNLSVLRKPTGVMAAGRWYPRSELDRLIGR